MGTFARWEDNLGFETVKGNTLKTADVTDGTWYIQVKGDYAGRISGAVYDLRDSSNPVVISIEPAWEKCEIPKASRRSSAEESSVRRMLGEWNEQRESRRRKLVEGDMTKEESDEADMAMIKELQTKVEVMKEQAKAMEAMESRIKTMMARMRNKSPAEKRLEERYGIEPMGKSLAEQFTDLQSKKQELSREEKMARAEAIKAKAATMPLPA